MFLARLVPVAPFLCLAALLSGCAVPLTEAERTPQLQHVTPKTVAIGVVDQREDVVSGRHGPTYEGHNSGLYGIPIVHNTRSGENLTDHLAAMAARGFIAKGARVEVVKLPTGEAEDKARADIVAHPADRHVLLIAKQWWVNYGGFTNELEYDVDAIVLDRAGNVLASKNFKGEDRNPIGGRANVFDEIEKAHRRRLEAILNDYEIARTL